MAYASLAAAVADLERTGRLRRIEGEVDPHLEMAEIQRRVYAVGGPALLFTRVKGTPFPCVSNLYGTRERARYLFRDVLEPAKTLLGLKADPLAWTRSPLRHLGALAAAGHALPRRTRSLPVAAHETTLDRLPGIVSWPRDGGPYVTLPQVFTEHPDRPGLRHSNLGMYRIQLAGASFIPGREAGLHYQIHRGIGAHHHAAIARGEKLRVCVFVGGPPAHALAAVMPLPEGMPEVYFAGLMAGRRFRWGKRAGYVLSGDADFCIAGTVDPARTLPEGPFGDHLGYYSLAHPFPVLEVEKVWHREGAIWPFTVVGRPPQEDSHLAEIIHELAGPALPAVLPGVHAVHAVESAGVHPLLLALGSERYVPYAERKPRELLTQANALLGFGQLSLAKYLLIAAREDAPGLDIRDAGSFLRHVLERADWRCDLHFQTRTTMDTLDYSGTGLNEGSKVVIAAAGPKRRDLDLAVPAEVAASLPDGFADPRSPLPGVLVLTAPPFVAYAAGAGGGGAVGAGMPPGIGGTGTAGEGGGGPGRNRERDPRNDIQRLIAAWEDRFSPGGDHALAGFPLVVLADDSAFAAADLHNFLWVAFTRSDPARDLHGTGAFIDDKHWGCRGALILDARRKPHHAPPLESDPEVARRVEARAARGGDLAGLL